MTDAVKALQTIMARVPSRLKERMAETAKDESVSQNTLMTASLFLSTLAWGKMPIVGPPQNVLMLLNEIDRAVEGKDDLVFGAFHTADWADVETFTRLFLDCGFVESFQFRVGQATKETIAYSFSITKQGASVLPMVTWVIRLLLDGRKSESVQEVA
jgi:hypothetical protein